MVEQVATNPTLLQDQVASLLVQPLEAASVVLAAGPRIFDTASYEAALEELEQLVARIESGQMPLEQLLSGYQRGATLLAFCRERLEAVQDQIKVLDAGQIQPWTAE